MASLPQLIPEVDYLLSLEAEDLAAFVLIASSDLRQNGLVSFGYLMSTVESPYPHSPGYKDRRTDQIRLALAEAWNWLEVQGLLLPAPGINGPNGFRVFSRRAAKMASADEVKTFARSRRIERDRLHPRIAQTVWSAYMRGEYDVAVLQAMKAVEIYVREAGGFGAGDIGVDLMRRAFHEDTGPLTDKSVEKSERQARSALFAGAIGSYKNPHSHREVNLNDPDEALEIVHLANHLLRIVDGRVRSNACPTRRADHLM
ncbi:MAG TPA: TIGR02391 family protein [Bradyrhizobium sp.]|nr:TIGR02391 family protein [Bradyrhizobium sp.]